jgi:hypothetical protein
MSMAENLEKAFLEQPVEERLTIAPELMDELNRRWASHLAGPQQRVTWDEIVAYVKRPRSRQAATGVSAAPSA